MARPRSTKPTGLASTRSRATGPSEEPPATATRRDLVLEAAQGVFLRYGFKKTSMDDLARAAGLSRQGLYLHFKTKEALFKAAFEHLLVQIHAATRAALTRSAASLEDRLLGAFEASHGHVFTSSKSDHLDELFGTATAMIGAQYEAAERELIAAIADALSHDGVAAAWKPAGITAKDLAEHLHATSYGVKHTVSTLAAYQARMRTAIKIVVRGAPR